MKLPSKEYYSRFKKLSNKDQLEMIDLYRRSHRIDTYYKTALLRFDDRLELTEISNILLFVYMYGAFTVNYFNDDTARLVFSIYGISVILWAYMVYYGIIRQLKSNE